MDDETLWGGGGGGDWVTFSCILTCYEDGSADIKTLRALTVSKHSYIRKALSKEGAVAFLHPGAL